MTEKNILIIGTARSGKTTLAKRFSKEKGCITSCDTSYDRDAVLDGILENYNRI